ncbi:MAG: pseudouridine synthase [Clostridiales bacterium]|nr:pseudouridine synthase [Clostridiales bacterium]
MPGSDNSEGPVRINRYIASCGICSRRAADKLIEEGRININGRTAVMGDTVGPDDTVTYDNEVITPAKKEIYIMLNKPRGITCTASPDDPDNIIDYLGYPERLFTIGRLDKESTGLILLTNDGITANKLLRAEGRHEKEYIVAVDKPVTEEFLLKMSSSIFLPELGKFTIPSEVMPNGERSFKIILTQGLNRQIRRMCEELGYHVVRLKRVRFANIVLGQLEAGQSRELTDIEIIRLKEIADHH